MPSRQFASVTPKWSSIASERIHPGVSDTAVASYSIELPRQRECHAVRCHLREVVEERAAVLGIELGVTVGDLDDQAARVLDEEWDGGVARDDVGVDGEPEHSQARVEVVLPQFGVPRSEVVAAPDVVDEDVEVPSFRIRCARRDPGLATVRDGRTRPARPRLRSRRLGRLCPRWSRVDPSLTDGLGCSVPSRRRSLRLLPARRRRRAPRRGWRRRPVQPCRKGLGPRSPSAPPYAMKYLASGWGTMIAEVLCSGSSWNSSVSATPMRSMLEQLVELRLVLEVGARGVAPRVARAAVLLAEQAGERRAVLVGEAPLLADAAVPQLGERLGHLDREPVAAAGTPGSGRRRTARARARWRARPTVTTWNAGVVGVAATRPAGRSRRCRGSGRLRWRGNVEPQPLAARGRRRSTRRGRCPRRSPGSSPTPPRARASLRPWRSSSSLAQRRPDARP